MPPKPMRRRKTKKTPRKTTKPRRRIRTRRATKLTKTSLISQYAKCLASPFICPSVRPGYDTFIPTHLAAGYYRGTVTLAQGCGTFIFSPDVANTIIYSCGVVASSVPSWSITPAANATVIGNQYDMMRVVAGGVRIHPLLAATQTPGLMQSGLMPRLTLTEFNTFGNANGVNSFGNLPYLQTHAKTATIDGIEVAWRPQDNRDFEMQEYDTAFVYAPGGVLTATNTISHTDTMAPMLVVNLSGFPTATQVYVEVLFHLECTTSIGLLTNITEDDSAQTMADNTSITSFQSAYRSVAESLPPLTTVLTGITSLGSLGILQAVTAHNPNAVWLPD